VIRIGDTLRESVKSVLPGDGGCSHLDQARMVEPRSEGCEECIAMGQTWVHLRLCLSCGHVGCCDQSVGRHAFHHFEDTGHAIMRSHEPGEVWGWCWIDEMEV